MLYFQSQLLCFWKIEGLGFYLGYSVLTQVIRKPNTPGVFPAIFCRMLFLHSLSVRIESSIFFFLRFHVIISPDAKGVPRLPVNFQKTGNYFSFMQKMGLPHRCSKSPKIKNKLRTMPASELIAQGKI